MSLQLPPVRVGPSTWDFSRTLIFGVLNVTPDSFSDGGRFDSVDAAVEQAKRLIAIGADAIDIGGESTRPKASPIAVDDELSRVLPVIEALSPCVVPISIDTYKARVAREAVAAGASIINDVSGLRLDDKMVDVVAETEATVIIGHLRGSPATMMQNIQFDDVVGEVLDELRSSIRLAISKGVAPEKLWTDPCVGFGKTAEQSMALIWATNRLREELGYPVLIGPSRKSFIGKVTGEPVDQRLMGTCAASSVAIARGADGLRLHDVEQLVSAVKIADAISRGAEGRERSAEC
jgi:dihydropteroate synthase